MAFINEYRIHKIDQRVKLLEEAVFKKLKRFRGTEAQRFLILYHLGIVEQIRKMDLSQNLRDLLVSVMLDIDIHNSKKFLSESAKKERPLLNTVSNYTFLLDFFEKLGVEKNTSEVEKILNILKEKKER